MRFANEKLEYSNDCINLIKLWWSTVKPMKCETQDMGQCNWRMRVGAHFLATNTLCAAPLVMPGQRGSQRTDAARHSQQLDTVEISRSLNLCEPLTKRANKQPKQSITHRASQPTCTSVSVKLQLFHPISRTIIVSQTSTCPIRTFAFPVVSDCIEP